MARLVLIMCASGAFRRGGLTFGHDPILVDLDELSDGAVAAIEGEELLTIAEANDEDVARLSGPAAEPSAESAAAFGMANELTGVVSAVLSRFAPDMEVAPHSDESPLETIVRLLELLVTHETPCDKRIASLQTELSSARSSIETLTKERDDAVEGYKAVTEQLAASEERVKDLEALKLKDIDPNAEVALTPGAEAKADETPPADAGTKKKAGGKS